MIFVEFEPEQTACLDEDVDVHSGLICYFCHLCRGSTVVLPNNSNHCFCYCKSPSRAVKYEDGNHSFLAVNEVSKVPNAPVHL